jgi:hypothetical protein
MMSLDASLSAYVAEQCDAVRVDVDYVGVADWAFPENSEAKWSGDPCNDSVTLQITIGDAGTWTVHPKYHVWLRVPQPVTDAVTRPSSPSESAGTR